MMAVNTENALDKGKKVFGYPEFDRAGEEILTTYDNEYADMMMDIRGCRQTGARMSSMYGCTMHPSETPLCWTIRAG